MATTAATRNRSADTPLLQPSAGRRLPPRFVHQAEVVVSERFVRFFLQRVAQAALGLVVSPQLDVALAKLGEKHRFLDAGGGGAAQRRFGPDEFLALHPDIGELIFGLGVTR